MPSSSERKLVHDEKTTSGNLLTENYKGRLHGLSWAPSVYLLSRLVVHRLTLSSSADDNIFTSSGGPLNLSVAPPFWLPEPVSAGDWSNGFPLGSRQPNHSPPSPPHLTTLVTGPSVWSSAKAITPCNDWVVLFMTGRFFGNKWFLYLGISMILERKY